VSKAELFELVELASRGEEVPISVRGKVKARLTRAAPPHRSRDRSAWVRQLRSLQKNCSTAGPKISAEEMLAGEGLTG